MAVPVAGRDLDGARRSVKKNGQLALGDERRYVIALPDDHPLKIEVAPVIARVDEAAFRARRCRVVNRVLGTQMTPGQIAALIPDEEIDVYMLLDEEQYIDDPATMIRAYLEAMSSRV